MKNKIHKYDFLIVGAGLIGAIAALALIKKKFKVLVIDKKDSVFRDARTLAVNANSIDFLRQLGIWNKLKSKPQPIEKIIIKDYVNIKPLIFESNNEHMGEVIYNKEVYKLARQKLKSYKVLKTNINIKNSELLPNKELFISNKNYIFKKIIISIGKNVISSREHKSIIFDQQHHSYVGFFKHNKDHRNTAYEYFTDRGPLAILPAPGDSQKKSTFIYSTKDKITNTQLKKLIKGKIIKTYGKLIFNQSIFKFPINPHLIKSNKNFIYIGDSLKSIHPVAGQGWNLGVKDIQTLCKLLEQYSLETENFNSLYYARRITESTIYFTFTTFLNFLYENKNSFNNAIIKTGFNTLKNIKFARDLFIKQAMGRVNLID